ncbi:MAG TPA: tagaturonate reductase, partial [Enterococcus casseliflavus]|nr:tagaturonate reductase [Enterococcus casseliflavus]
MKKITEQPHQTYPARVIQFGEGNFMRGFFNWQLQQMNKQGLFNGSAVVVQPIDHGLKELLAQQENLYTVILEGLVDGAPSQTFEVVSTIDQVLNPYQQWEDYLALAEDEQLEIIVSNTTEAGIAFHPEDTLHDTPPHSFPAKLTALLYRRFQRQKPGFLIIPCELIDRNGEKLKEIVLQYAALWSLESDFVNWLEKENTFCCSLVDRIVPGYPRDKVAQYQEILGYEDAVMVTAEPFMLWVIEGSGVAEKLPLQEAGL